MRKRFYLFVLFTALYTFSYSQPYTFNDFVGTWHGTISSTSFGGYNDPMTMIIYEDHFYTETSGHLMPTIYPNTQECDYDVPTNRMHWWWLQTVYAGQSFYTHVYYEVVYFSNDTLIMHYNFWDDPQPHPDAGTIFLVRENLMPPPSNLSAQVISENIQLDWSVPSNIPQGSSLQGYNVYYSENNGPYTVLDYVEGVTSYTHAGYFQAGSHNYYVSGVYNIGESDPSNYAEVITTALPPISDFVSDNTVPAISDTVVFTDLSTNAPSTWNWSFSPGTVEFLQGTNANSQHPVVRFTDIAIYTVSLTVSNIAGDDIETKTAYINATSAAPVADFTWNAMVPAIGDTVSFMDLSMYDPDTWDWEINPSTYEFVNGTGSSSQNPEIKFLASDIYSVELTVTNNTGSDSKMEFISVMDGNVLTVMISATFTEICEGESAELSANVYGGSGNYMYSWTSDPEGFISYDPVIEVFPEVTTVYMLEVYDGSNTSGSNIEIMVNELPEITLENWPGELCRNGAAVQLYALPAGGTFSGDHVTPDGIFDPLEAETGWNQVTYSYINEFGCEAFAQDSIFVDNCTSTNEINRLESEISVYPNPATDVINILSGIEMNAIRIVNNQGQLVQSIEIKSKNRQVNVATLREGLYFFIMETAEGQATKRVLVQ